jgi:hypothetical protein
MVEDLHRAKANEAERAAIAPNTSKAAAVNAAGESVPFIPVPNVRGRING